MKIDLSPATDWWAGRTERERLMLTVMLVLLGALVAWYGVIQPLRHGARSASEARAESAMRLEEARVMAREIEILQGRFGAPRSGEALEALVVKSAAENGVALDRRQADGAALTVWADAADPKTFLAWLALLQSRDGVAVTSLTALPGPGGRVQMQAALVG